MSSAIEGWASLSHANAGFKPESLAVVDLLRLVDWITLFAGSAVILFVVVVVINRRRTLPHLFSAARTSRAGPELLLVPFVTYLAAAWVMYRPVAWWLSESPHELSASSGDEATEEPPIDLAGVLVNNLAMIFGAAAGYVTGRRFIATVSRPFVLGDRRIGRCLAEAFAATLAALVLTELVLLVTIQLIELIQPDYVFQQHGVITVLRDPRRPTWLPAALWIGVVVVTPFAEELFFRGLLQTTVAGLTGSRVFAVVAAGAVFGLAHGAQPHVVPALALFGMVLGLLYERSGSLAGPIFAHALFNARTLMWEALGAN